MKIGLAEQFGEVAEGGLQGLAFSIGLDRAAIGHALLVFVATAFAALVRCGVEVTCKFRIKGRVGISRVSGVLASRSQHGLRA